MTFANVAQLTQALKAASEAHHKFETESGKPDSNWADWYANYIFQTVPVYPEGYFEPLPAPNHKTNPLIPSGIEFADLSGFESSEHWAYAHNSKV